MWKLKVNVAKNGRHVQEARSTVSPHFTCIPWELGVAAECEFLAYTLYDSRSARLETPAPLRILAGCSHLLGERLTLGFWEPVVSIKFYF